MICKMEGDLYITGIISDPETNSLLIHVKVQNEDTNNNVALTIIVPSSDLATVINLDAIQAVVNEVLTCHSPHSKH